MTETNLSAAISNNREMQLAEFFKVLSCTSRINILRVLLRGEASAGELARQLDLSCSSISHQMQILRASKLVRKRRVGKTILYTLANDSVRSMIDSSMKCAGEQVLLGLEGDNGYAQ